MDTSQVKPTAEQVKKWDEEKLLDWINKTLPNPLSDDTAKKFKEMGISGRAFLTLADKADDFENKLKLNFGLSRALADLAQEIKEGETAGMSYMPRTLRRLQANNVTGNRQQAEGVDMTNIASEIDLPVRGFADPLHLTISISEGLAAGIKSKFAIFIHERYVDCKLTTSQETHSRQVQRCPTLLPKSCV